MDHPNPFKLIIKVSRIKRSSFKEKGEKRIKIRGIQARGANGLLLEQLQPTCKSKVHSNHYVGLVRLH